MRSTSRDRTAGGSAEKRNVIAGRMTAEDVSKAQQLAQAVAGHWYCPGAQELSAYRTQQAWLAELGLELDVNWIAVVLESGCTPRDFHPD